MNLVDSLEDLNPTVNEILMMEDSQESSDDSATCFTGKSDDAPEEKEDIYYSGDSMHLYLKEIGRIPLLSSEEEAWLGKEIKEGGPNAVDARNRLVQANLRLVVHCAKRFLGRGMDMEDLNAMGTEGLIRAAEKYDYTLGFRFSTYATWWICQAISRGLADEAGPVRIPVHLQEMINKVRKAQKALYQDKAAEPTVGEIAGYLNVTEEAVMTAVHAMYSTVSLDKKTGKDEDITIGEFLPDENAEDPCETAVNEGLRKAVRSVLGMLEPKEALVLSLRYGIDVPHPMTLEAIAGRPEFGVTRERIRQIEEKALRKIRRSPKMIKLLRDYAA